MGGEALNRLEREVRYDRFLPDFAWSDFVPEDCAILECGRSGNCLSEVEADHLSFSPVWALSGN
jgi:hypothetical protein